MRITRVSQISGKSHTMEMDVTPEQMAELEAPNRRLIQDIFPHLTDGEREFLLTGITEAEWAAAFPPEESISAAEFHDAMTERMAQFRDEMIEAMHEYLSRKGDDDPDDDDDWDYDDWDDADLDDDLDDGPDDYRH